MTVKFFSCFVIFCCTLFATSQAQIVAPKDSVFTEEEISEETAPRVKPRNKNAMRATIMSAVLPGLGQVYNRKYWKVPIIYGLGGFLVYLARDNYGYYQAFKQAYADTLFFKSNPKDPNVKSLNGRAYGIYPDLSDFSVERLKYGRDQYLRDMQMYIILMTGVYILNIIDATVDAHLRNFNVNENLEARILPEFKLQPMTGMSVGMNMTFTFRK